MIFLLTQASFNSRYIPAIQLSALAFPPSAFYTCLSACRFQKLENTTFPRLCLFGFCISTFRNGLSTRSFLHSGKRKSEYTTFQVFVLFLFLLSSPAMVLLSFSFYTFLSFLHWFFLQGGMRNLEYNLSIFWIFFLSSFPLTQWSFHLWISVKTIPQRLFCTAERGI